MPRGRHLPGSNAGAATGPAAVELRVCGASFADIAETLGLATSKQAQAAVERELARHLTPASIEVQRAEASARIERLLAAVMPRALNPSDPEQLAASRVALALADRHIRLHGLDKPSEMIIHTPTSRELEAWVAGMAATVMPNVIEADVVPAALAIEAGDD